MDSTEALPGPEAWQHEVWKKNKYIEVGSNEDGDLAYGLGPRWTLVLIGHH